MMGFRRASLQEKGNLLKEIHAVEPYLRFDRERSSVDVMGISFYRGGLLVRCQKTERREGADFLWYVKLPEKEIVALDGSTANIHHLNFHAPLLLTEKTLPDYLKFRLYFVTPRRYLDSTADIKSGHGGFVCHCSFYEDGNFFTARVSVDHRGVTEISGQELQTARLEQMPEFSF